MGGAGLTRAGRKEPSREAHVSVDLARALVGSQHPDLAGLEIVPPCC